ncbi:MAG: hypothetical protein JSS49_11130 [Planctomycetes bacterium]|nr:hypothetical protein [Planctomycetota bacterium]
MFEWTVYWPALVIDVSLKTLLLAGITGLTLSAVRLRNSAAKHAAWTGVLSAFLILPVMSMTLPAVPMTIPNWLLRIAESSSDISEPASSLNPGISPSLQAAWRHEEPEMESGVSPYVIRTPDVNALASLTKPVSTSWTLPAWLPVMTSVWILGAIVMMARLGFSIAITRRLVARSTVISPMNERLSRNREVRPDTSRRASITLRESPFVLVPMTTGWWRPNILLPVAWHTWTAEKLGHVLDHERAHLRRGDNWTALAAEVTTCLYWFHPLSWWLRRQLSALAEACCDDAAIGVPEKRAAYARHLLEIASVLSGQPHRLHYAGLAITRHSQVERRILAILDTSRPLSKRLSRTRALLWVGILVPVLAASAVLKPTMGTSAEPQDIAAGSAVSSVKPDNSEAVNDQAAERSVVPGSVPAIRVHGRITVPTHQAAVGAFVAIVGETLTNDRGSISVTLAEGMTDQDGQYELAVTGESTRTDGRPRLIVRMKGRALAEQSVDFDRKDSHIDLTLQPEQVIKVRLVDAQGTGASHVVAVIAGITPAAAASDRPFWLLDLQPLARVVPTFVTDQDGFLEIHHVAAGCGVHLHIRGNEKFAPQQVSLNTGMPESRPDNDATYRPFVRNLRADETATIPLAPATPFAGIVRLGNTDKPAANVKITVWSGQQEIGGSMIALTGETDADGRFRLNPYPGVRFGIDAFPPAGTSYQIRRLQDVKWESEASQKLEIRLALGVLAQGTVMDAVSGKPLAGASVQYHPEQANPNVTDDIVTGWQSIQQTDGNGRFQIPVVPGPGTLLVHAPQGTSYILQQRGSRELQWGQPGGIRYYAHAFQKIDPAASAPGTEPSVMAPLSIKLQPSGTVTANLVDLASNSIQEAIYTSRLFILPLNPFWRAYSEKARNGQAVIRGLEPGQRYPVCFLDVKRQLGATAMVSLDDPQPTIVLQPCAAANARYLLPSGKPVKQGTMFGLTMLVTPGKPKYTIDPVQKEALEADEDFSTNFDGSRNQRGTDQNGVEHYQLLIPGATYRFLNLNGGKVQVAKEFIAKAGEIHELGEITVNLEN